MMFVSKILVSYYFESMHLQLEIVDNFVKVIKTIRMSHWFGDVDGNRNLKINCHRLK